MLYKVYKVLLLSRGKPQHVVAFLLKAGDFKLSIFNLKISYHIHIVIEKFPENCLLIANERILLNKIVQLSFNSCNIAYLFIRTHFLSQATNLARFMISSEAQNTIASVLFTNGDRLLKSMGPKLVAAN